MIKEYENKKKMWLGAAAQQKIVANATAPAQGMNSNTA